jgi:hypothetical protein
MKSNLKPTLPETIWIATALLLTIISAAIVADGTFLIGSVAIHSEALPLMIPSWYLAILIITLVTFVLYFIKEQRRSFDRKISSLALITFGVFLIVLLTLFVKSVADSNNVGANDSWTAYPPFSIVKQTDDSNTNLAQTTLIVSQVAILLMILQAAYGMGKNNQ